LKYEYQRDSSVRKSVSGLEEKEEPAILDTPYSTGENGVEFILYSTSTHQRWSQIFQFLLCVPCIIR
jgi:hypothetical protein